MSGVSLLHITAVVAEWLAVSRHWVCPCAAVTESFLAFGPDTWFTLTGVDVVKCNRLAETADITVLTWLKLPLSTKNIQTIASNRATGCGEVTLRRQGFAFYVNSWMASDLKLKVCAGAAAAVSGVVPAACCHVTTPTALPGNNAHLHSPHSGQNPQAWEGVTGVAGSVRS